ncbi:immunoglobulin mu heavy chain-like [Dicentrarchus labrax]|uniref:immunoglobulin mu heavy chain-like n=1 Tax=Dicentrarchus labrax TaxID=13489 RepID=UPI0021F55896|nr:immunoglobulin mu heavy chain-like [Dicentrarchus labrax]
MFSVALLLLLAAGCVKCEQLTQPASVTVQPGQRLTITCQVSYSVSSYYTAWIRQPAGKGLEWISSDTDIKDSLKNKFSVTLDSSSNTVTLNGQNVQPEDSAVYYCARDTHWQARHCDDYFDYWGRGTQVTVSSGTPIKPTVFPLMQCGSGSGDTVTLGCLATGFTPSSLTYSWSKNGTPLTDFIQYPAVQKNNVYMGVSQIRVSRQDWDARQPFQCVATHAAGNTQAIVKQRDPVPPKVTLLSEPRGDSQALLCIIEDFFPNNLTVNWKKNQDDVAGTTWDPVLNGDVYSAVSVLKVKNTDWNSNAVYKCVATHRGQQYKKIASKATVTVTLNQPSAKEIFSNNEAKLECIVTGRDKSIVNEIQITWQIDEQTVAENIESRVSSDGDQHSKTSTMSRNRTEWQGVNKVRCSAAREDMTPVVQDLTVHKGDVSKTKVTVHVLPGEVNKEAEVSLVCLVFSPVLQDSYIAWSENIEKSPGIYKDGINFPPQKTKDGYFVTSVYTTTKAEWETTWKMFECNVWVAGSNESMKPRAVSKAQDFDPESELSCALSCTDEEDEFSSLWSTASSFIFLFISSLFYNMIFSLVKMKK